jgi:hypothetical protein
VKEEQKSYVAVDEIYRGVTIKNLMNLRKDDQLELIESADKRYLAIMR